MHKPGELDGAARRRAWRERLEVRGVDIDGSDARERAPRPRPPGWPDGGSGPVDAEA